jgi:signal transduction histidine kinase
MKAKTNVPRPLHSSARLAAAGLLAGVLLLGWGSAWYVQRVVHRSKETDLGLRLEAIGRVAADGLRAQFPLAAMNLAELALDLWPPDERSRYGEERRRIFEERSAELHEFLVDLARQANLRRVMIVDVHERAIADSAGQAQPFEIFEYLAIDRAEMQRAALTQETQTTPYYAVRHEPHKRAYAPIADEEGTVFAFIRLEASRDYFREMSGIRRRLAALSGLMTILLLIVALILIRLFRHLLHAEEAISQADRLQAVGTLAAGFAHEVRNPLGIIRSCAEGMAEEFPQNQEARSLARDMVEEVVRLDGLITQFLDFARPAGTGTWRPVDVGKALQAVASLARKDIEAKRLEMRLELDPDAGAVNANEKALRQVFLNILLNAKDATEPGGRITASAQKHRGRVVVSITDTGVGIPPGDLGRVFDPFFTTKQGGTGLGLALSRNIVQQFGGQIDIRSQLNRGTTVEISFPTRFEA